MPGLALLRGMPDVPKRSAPLMRPRLPQGLGSSLVADPAQELAARLALGRALLAARRMQAGVEQLWEAARLDLRFNDGEPRKALLEAFEALGEESPLTREYRRKLSVLLCA